MIQIWMKKNLVSDSNCNIAMDNAQIFLIGMTNIVRFTMSINDITHVVCNEHWARQIELVTLNTIFSVVFYLSNTQETHRGNQPQAVMT